MSAANLVVKRRRDLNLLLVGLGLASTACGDATGPLPPIENRMVTIDVIPRSLFLSALQDQASLFFVVRDTSGRFIAPSDTSKWEVAWSSDNRDVVSVSDQGVVTATGRDTATVMASVIFPETKLVLATARTTVKVLTWTQIAPGREYACALTSDKDAYCWGRNDGDQLGDGKTSDKNAPVEVETALKFDSIVSGGDHTCGLDTDSLLHCWGANSEGQLGDGSRTNSNIPTRVTVADAGGTITRFTKFTTVAAGGDHTCGIANDSTAYCWGDNTWGQLSVDGVGDEEVENPLGAVRASKDLKFTAIVAGNRHTCGITADTIPVTHCWGDDDAVQLGRGANPDTNSTRVAGSIEFRTLAAADDFTCGIDMDDATWCWGTNVHVPLGDSISSPTPVRIADAPPFETIAVGDGHICGLTSMGVAYCWGDNANGQLGNGSDTNDNGTPAIVSGGQTFLSVHTGAGLTCGITVRETAFCWGGDGSGQLGTGAENEVDGADGSVTPVRVMGPFDPGGN